MLTPRVPSNPLAPLAALARAHQRRALENARSAATEAARHRLERAEVAGYLARHAAARVAGGPPAVAPVAF